MWGCRSLLQSAEKYGEGYETEEPPYSTDKNNIPRGVKQLLVPRRVKKRNYERDEAENYDTPAIFNFSHLEHRVPIKEMFEYMARHEARGF